MLSKRIFSLWSVFAAVLALGGLLGDWQAQAQELTDICLKNGVRVRARVEFRDKKILLYMQGNPTAADMTDQVHSIGAADDPICKGPGPVPNVSTSCEPSHFSIRGSNTIGERLMPTLIEGYSKKTYGTAPKVTFPKPEEGTIEISRPNCPEPVVAIDYQSKGSGTAPPALKERQIAIGMMSRRMKDEEVADLQKTLDITMTGPESEHIVALDGLAVIVNHDNPIKTLPLEQIAKIFSGEITNWKDVSGKNEKGEEIHGQNAAINVHARDNKSGTYDTFKSIVLEREEPKRKLIASAKRYESSEQLSGEVAKDLDAIGFIGFPYINQNQALGISSSCGLSTEPETFQVKLETYPLARRLFLYTPGTPSELTVKNLLDFSLSDGAQSLVVETGFIDQTVDFQDAKSQRHLLEQVSANSQFALEPNKPVPARAARQFADLAGKLQRSSVIFRFASGKSVLDNLALQNVSRLARYLNQPSMTGHKVFLVGFANSNGGWGANLGLSLTRANTVAQALQSQGVRPGVLSQTGLSYMAPVACNGSDKERALNRRVEVWIAK